MGDRGWVSSYIFYFCLVLFYFLVWHSQSLYLGGQNMMAVISVSLIFLFFFNQELLVQRNCWCLLCKTILKVSYLIVILWIFLENRECFDFNHSLGCVYTTLYIIGLLVRVYHISLLICFPCSSYSYNLKVKYFSFCFHFKYFDISTSIKDL